MKNLFILILCLTGCIACSDRISGTEDESKMVIFRDGSETHPFFPEDFKDGSELLGDYLDAADNVWVEGWVVGYVAGTKINTTVLGAGEESKASNIVICGIEDGSGQLMPVQLSNSPEDAKSVRQQLNLLDNPDMLGRKVQVRGRLSSYMATVGLKSTDAVIIF